MSFSEGEGGHRAADLVLEGQPPGSDRPSWLVLAVGVAAALLIGLAVGYGVGSTPSATPESTVAVASREPSPSPTATPVANPFMEDPCRLVPTSPIRFLGGSLGIEAQKDVARKEPSALPGMVDCTYFDEEGHLRGAVSLRQAPTTAAELAVIVDEVFTREGVSETSIQGQHAYFIQCAHAWGPCRAAIAVVHEPFFLVISLAPDLGGFEVVSALAAGILGSLPN